MSIIDKSKQGDRPALPVTEFGLVNGITRLAQDVENYDNRVDMERYAGRRLEQALVAK